MGVKSDLESLEAYGRIELTNTSYSDSKRKAEKFWDLKVFRKIDGTVVQSVDKNLTKCVGIALEMLEGE